MRMEKVCKKNSCKSKLKKIVIIFIIIPLLLTIAAVCAWFTLLYTGEEQVDKNKLNFTPANLRITDINGQYVDLPESYDSYASSVEIPDKLKKAFVTLEDKRFYEHSGVDHLRVIKAALKNLKSGGIKEGASTISQQLIKNTHLSSERSFERKIAEARLAIKLEKQYTKDEILTMYLNMLYFGSGEYGVKNAARRFFGKELNDLDLAECAMLAGIVKSPTRYNPINNFERSNERKELVLEIMRKEGAITNEEFERAQNYKIVIKNNVNESNSAFLFLEYSIEECAMHLNMTPEQLLSSGYIIETYLDNDAQTLLKKVMTNPALTLKTAGGEIPDNAAVVIDNFTGGVKAFWSNCGYTPQTNRQPGSTLKPLVCYAPALECGAIYPSTAIDDTKKSFSGYSPNNYKDEYHGRISVRECLKQSLNIPAVEVMNMVGVERACSYLPQLGIKLEESDYNFSTALGGMTYGTNITDIAAAYSSFARGGLYKNRSFVRQVKTTNGDIVFTSLDSTKRVFNEDTAYLITDMLVDTAISGSAKKLSGLKFPIASKTGTVSSSDPKFNTDAYNVSYTSSETAVFWQGNLSGKSDGMLPQNITGGGSPTLMAKNYFSRSRAEKKPFNIPDDIVYADIDKYEYAQGNVVLADAAAPKYAVKKEIFSSRYLPNAVNRSYSMLARPQIFIERLDNMRNITISADPRLNYAVILRDYFSGDRTVQLFDSGKSEYSFAIQVESGGLFAPRYAVKVYYTDDNGQTVFRIYPIDRI